MKFTYLTDESEKSLAPFFSPMMMSATVTSVSIIGGLFVVFWPWQNFSRFIGEDKNPATFFQIFTALLIINSYINLRCGRGEIFKSDYFSWYYKETATFEKERDFLGYGLIEFLLHTLFLMVPFLPILLLATAISGLSLNAFIKVCSIVFMASLLCRMAGFLIYLFWGRLNLFGYLVARIFLAVFILGTIILAPRINPILNIYKLNKNFQSIELSSKISYSFYITTLIVVLGIFVIVIEVLIRHYIKLAHQTHEKNR